MIKFVLFGLKELGFEDPQIITTLEKRMKCGIGICGRCNAGSKYVCLDGPVSPTTRSGPWAGKCKNIHPPRRRRERRE